MKRKLTILFAVCSVFISMAAFVLHTLEDAANAKVEDVEHYYAQQQPIVRHELKRLKTSNPTLDFQRAWQKKDYRFIGVNGFPKMVPGVKGGYFDHTVEKYGMNVVRGTDVDVSYSREAAQLQYAAVKYAEQYNRMLMTRLQANKMVALRFKQATEQIIAPDCYRLRLFLAAPSAAGRR